MSVTSDLGDHVPLPQETGKLWGIKLQTLMDSLLFAKMIGNKKDILLPKQRFNNDVPSQKFQHDSKKTSPKFGEARGIHMELDQYTFLKPPLVGI